MPADLTTYDKDLKDNYAPAIEKQLNTKTVLLNRIKRDSTTIEGRQFIVPTQGRRSEGVASRPGTSSSLPTAGEVGFDNATYTPKYHWGQIQVSQVIIEHTKRESGAWTKAVSAETKSMTETLTSDLNRQVFNDGTGLISRTGVTTAANVVVLATAGGYRVLGNNQLRVGMYVDILTRSNGAVIATNRKITAVDRSANTITIDGAAVTTAATDGVYRAGNKSGANNYEMNGLRIVVGTTGAIGGLDPATAGQDYWASQVVQGAVPGTPEAISEVRMQKVKDLAAEFSSSDDGISLLLAHYNTRRSYFNLLQSLKRFTGGQVKKLSGGFDALDFGGLDFVVDKDCQPNTIYFLDEGHLKWYELARPQWMDGDGSILKWDQGTGYKAVYYWFAQFGTDNRAAQGRLEDVTES